MLPSVYYCGGYGLSRYDVVTAIMSWVELGTAPDKIMTTQYSNDSEQQAGGPP